MVTLCPPPCVYAALWSTEPLLTHTAAGVRSPGRRWVRGRRGPDLRGGYPQPSAVPPAHAAALGPAGAGMSQLWGREAAVGNTLGRTCQPAA